MANVPLRELVGAGRADVPVYAIEKDRKVMPGDSVNLEVELITLGRTMYDMYPDRWTGDDDRRNRDIAERPRRRARRAHGTQPEIIRVRQERDSSAR